MSVLPKEFIELMTKKRELETKIQTAMTDFENHFGGAITIGDVDLLKIKTVCGQQRAVVTVSLEIA